MTDSPRYRARKAYFARMLTVYGRKPVLEVLQDASLPVHQLHLADSNRSGGIIDDILHAAARRGISVRHHSRAELARISRNGRQDQGVAVDLDLPGHCELEDRLDQIRGGAWQLLALDRITNPQNLGMIVRAACAGGVDGILLPRKGCAELSPLVIKASAGTLFKAPLLRCDDLGQALQRLREHDVDVAILSSYAETSLFDFRPRGACVYVLGNETDGVGEGTARLASQHLVIPMANGVESLNVAVAAGIIAYRAGIVRSGH